MDIQEKEAIEKQFERSLELLVRGKFPLTATAIVCAEQPMILLFKELIHRIEKRESELDKKDKIIDLMAKEIHINNIFDCDYKHFLDNKCRLEYPDVPNEYKCKQCIIDYFTNKYEEGKG